MTGPKNALAAALLSLVSVIWGGSFIAARIALRELSPVSLATLRFGLVAVFFLFVLAALPRYRAPWRSLPRLMFFGLLAVTFYFILQYGGVARTSASLSAVVITLSPLVVVLLSRAFLHESLTASQIAGIVLATAGALLLVTRGSLEVGGSDYWLGILFLVLDVLAWGVYNIIGKRALHVQHPTTLTSYMMILGALGLIPFAIADGGLAAVPHLSASAWAAVAYLVILSTIVAYLAYNYALQILPASRAGVFQYLNPVAAVLFAHLLLSEPLTIVTVIGGSLAIGGVYLVNRHLDA